MTGSADRAWLFPFLRRLVLAPFKAVGAVFVYCIDPGPDFFSHRDRVGSDTFSDMSEMEAAARWECEGV